MKLLSEQILLREKMADVNSQLSASENAIQIQYNVLTKTKLSRAKAIALEKIKQEELELAMATQKAEAALATQKKLEKIAAEKKTAEEQLAIQQAKMAQQPKKESPPPADDVVRNNGVTTAVATNLTGSSSKTIELITDLKLAKKRFRALKNSAKGGIRGRSSLELYEGLNRQNKFVLRAQGNRQYSGFFKLKEGQLVITIRGKVWEIFMPTRAINQGFLLWIDSKLSDPKLTLLPIDVAR